MEVSEDIESLYTGGLISTIPLYKFLNTGVSCFVPTIQLPGELQLSRRLKKKNLLLAGYQE